METIRRLGYVEFICLLNFLAFAWLWWNEGGLLLNTPNGLVFSIDIISFIPWLITAVPAIIASVYGLANLDVSHLSHEERTKRLVVCVICLVGNAALIAAMTIPNDTYQFKITDLYSLMP